MFRKLNSKSAKLKLLRFSSKKWTNQQEENPDEAYRACAGIYAEFSKVITLALGIHYDNEDHEKMRQWGNWEIASFFV